MWEDNISIDIALTITKKIHSILTYSFTFKTLKLRNYFYCCTVHFEFTDYYTPTNALLYIMLFSNFTLKHLKAPTCFDLLIILREHTSFLVKFIW
jgi:hypothetical protein